MKRLLITLILVSPFSFADWGDVYYCQMNSASRTAPDGEREDFVLDKFKFKLDETEKAVVFGEKGYFKGSSIKLSSGSNLATNLWSFASGDVQVGIFDKGKFLFSLVLPDEGIYSITADCDKF